MTLAPRYVSQKKGLSDDERMRSRWRSAAMSFRSTGWAAPGPGHSSKDRSLSVLIMDSDFIVTVSLATTGVSARITCGLASASRLSTTGADHGAHAGARVLQFGTDRSEDAASLLSQPPDRHHALFRSRPGGARRTALSARANTRLGSGVDCRGEPTTKVELSAGSTNR
jgi:hypothetical protein